ncbi:MAG: cofactor-independent phosphoglycerate mutase [Nitrospirae bacterium]|nr:cofactor-independent phosphoglycerate mutase [Nitrospirota bacterium]NTW66056.1 cofactor-independent phosphoglycerate mutase [Nitrospirota bacterium]
MKYIILLGDGMADRPCADLGGKTCLQAARTPNLDQLATLGQVGMVHTVPDGYAPGSDVANLSVLGYDPRKYYTGRSPLEAASIGVALGPDDVAFRCNLVTLKLSGGGTASARRKALMEDFSAGHISTQEARTLIEEIDRALGSAHIRFYPGVSYRHLMVWKGGRDRLECTPPHDIQDKDIQDYLPRGEGDDIINELMTASFDLLTNHPVNKARLENGKRAANSIWLWGQGKRPSMPTFREKYGIEGAVISAVDLTKGLGVYAGFEVINVPGATGWLDTNYVGKAEHALFALKTKDFVYLHVEAPDEAGHTGDVKNKIRAIEDFDEFIVGNIMHGMKQFDEYRILALPDHPTPLEIRTHSAEPVPFVLYDSRNERKGGPVTYDERIADRKEALVFRDGYKLMDHFLKK